jgi:hypothetical protein
MALIKKFTPQNSDQFVGKDQGDHTLAKFGHLNYILRNITIQIGNVTIPAGYVIGPGPTSNVTNTAFGYTALDSNLSGLNNTAIGYNALTASTVANNNTALGFNALAAHTAVGNGNSVAIGAYALSTKTGISDSNNTAVGVLAMSDSGGTGGQSNVAVGCQALRNNNGNRNIAIGFQSMRFNTTGANNVALGYQGLYNTTGIQNVGLGYLSGLSITTGNYNVVLGNTFASSVATLSNFMIFADGQGNERFRVTNGGNVLVGGTTDAGQKHQVYGTALIQGSPAAADYTKSVLTIKNMNTAGQNTYGLVSMDSNVSGSYADIRLGTNPTGLRLYATDLPAATATGSGISMFRNTDINFPGQTFFDSGSNNSSALIFRTAPTSTNLTERVRVKSNGSVRFQPMAQPATAEAGDVYYDSGTNKLRCYDGSTWNDLF